ncbi:fluoride efflux transporter CrcB [Nitratifractor sp.]|uniref:fluoride efflux transporter CrcB n=1 Tax=Nitratifractor sp. TaxID=2268144 RepID=UPI0025D9C17D|nr:fluoride efflux transporter CrcB [Nitratifractor sp.]
MGVQIILAVALGGALGATGRFLISTGVHKLVGAGFPYGTLTVNVLGSFIIGFLYLYFEQTIAPMQKALLVTGMLGALTTFSTFSLESVLMLQDGLITKALANVLFNVILCLGATTAGMALFRRLYGL